MCGASGDETPPWHLLTSTEAAAPEAASVPVASSSDKVATSSSIMTAWGLRAATARLTCSSDCAELCQQPTSTMRFGLLQAHSHIWQHKSPNLHEKILQFWAQHDEHCTGLHATKNADEIRTATATMYQSAQSAMYETEQPHCQPYHRWHCSEASSGAHLMLRPLTPRGPCWRSLAPSDASS